MTPSAEDRDPLGSLLARTGSGDQQAFADLYRRAAGRLHAVCLRMLRDTGEAEEVVQEVFVTVWRRADRFDPARASAMTWLVALTRNRAIDRLRQRRVAPLGDPLDLEQMEDERPGPAADAQASQDYVRLRNCLEALEPKQRRSVREAFFTGATYKELAGRCQVPLPTLKSWIRRGLIQLRACLES
jgi:RNA polymerase sigma factor (sigma-70 family)